MPIKSLLLGKEIFRLNGGKVEVTQECPILCNPMDCSWPVSSGKSHGQRSLVGYSPRGRKESDTTERLQVHVHGISPTQGLNLGLLHWSQILYHLSHQGRPNGGKEKRRIRMKQKLDWRLNCHAPWSFWVNSSSAIRLHQGAKSGLKVRSRKAEFYLSFTVKIRQNDVLRKGGRMGIKGFFAYKVHHCYC